MLSIFCCPGKPLSQLPHGRRSGPRREGELTQGHVRYPEPDALWQAQGSGGGSAESAGAAHASHHSQEPPPAGRVSDMLFV